MKKPKKMMMGGMANAASRVPSQAGRGMAQAAGAGRPSAMPSQAGAGLARAAEMSGRAVGPRGMKKGGKVDGVAKKGKTKGRKC
jgi:hypothetical protein